jgi:hypothetical protein
MRAATCHGRLRASWGHAGAAEAGGSMVPGHDGIFPTWEANFNNVPSPKYRAVVDDRRSFAYKASEDASPTKRLSDGRSRLAREASDLPVLRCHKSGRSCLGARAATYTALPELPRLARRTAPTGDKGPSHDIVPALLQHCSGTRFYIQPLYTGSFWTIKREADIMTLDKRTTTEYTLSGALRTLHHTQRPGTFSLSRPKLVPPYYKSSWAYRTLLWTRRRAPHGARTSIIIMSLSPTVQIRHTNILKFTCRRYQTPTIILATYHCRNLGICDWTWKIKKS